MKLRALPPWITEILRDLNAETESKQMKMILLTLLLELLTT